VEVESVRRREEDAAAPTAICRMAKMVPAPHEPAEPLLVVRAQPITGAATDPEAGPLSPRSAVTEATQTVLRAVAEPERADHRWADEEVTGYTLERTVRGQRLPTRLIKVLIYWPLEDEHARESGMVSWIIFLAWLCLGIVASFESLTLGLCLAIAGIYGGALVRYFIVGRA
jgi:hypothetical protein